MNKEQLKGKLDNLKGRLKEAVGAATDDKKKEAEGLVDRAHGAAEEKLGDAKAAIQSDREGRDPDEKDAERRAPEEAEDD